MCSRCDGARMKPISQEVPDASTVERAIIALTEEGSGYLIGPLDPEEIDIGVKANQGLMYASATIIGDALTNLVAAKKLRIILAAKAGEPLIAYFGLPSADPESSADHGA